MALNIEQLIIADPSGVVANVINLTNNDGLATVILDANGDPITAFGGGTQYTEDAVAAANPVGTAEILIRADTPALQGADGDYVARRGTGYGAAYTQIVDSAGAFVDTFGGGTQYTEGAVDATITGNALLWEDAADTLRAVSAAKPLPVEVIAGATSGTEYTEGDVDATIAGRAILMEVAGNTLQPIQGTVADGLLVNLGTNNDVTVTGAALTALELIDDAIYSDGVGTVVKGIAIFGQDGTNPQGIKTDASGELQVDILTMPAITASNLDIRDLLFSSDKVDISGSTLAANSGVDIGDVTVNNASGGSAVNIQDGGNSITIDNNGTFLTQENGGVLTALQLIDDTVGTLGTTTYTEATTKALVISAVRRDADTTLVDTTNELAPLQVNSAGQLKVEIFDGGDSFTIDNNGTFLVQENGPALTALQVIDNPVVVDDAVFTPATTSVMMAGFTFDDSAPDSVNEGDAGAGRMSANRNIYMTIRDAAGNERGANVNASSQLSVSVDNTVTVGSHAVTNAGTFAVQATIAAGATAIAKAEDAVHASGDTGVFVLGVANEAQTTFAGDGDYIATATDVKGNALTVGNLAHDAADAGNPVKVGYKALSALPTAVATSDRANGISDLFGRQLTSHIDPAMFVSKSFNATTTQTGTDVWSPTSGKRIAITSIIIGTYGTTAGRVILFASPTADTTYTEGTDQAIIKASFAPSTTSKPGLVFTPAVPVFINTADYEIHITTDAAISIDVVVTGYEY